MMEGWDLHKEKIETGVILTVVIGVSAFLYVLIPAIGTDALPMFLTPTMLALFVVSSGGLVLLQYKLGWWNHGGLFEHRDGEA